MRKEAVRILGVVSVLVLVLFAVFVANQTADLVETAERLGPSAGRATLLSLLGLYALIGAAFLWALVRFPRALRVPAPDDEVGIAAHVAALGHRLRGNPALAGSVHDLGSRAGVDGALADLGKKADEVTRATAGVVFLTTAVSQFGRLDGLIVLVTHARMIWRIAALYRQRPSLPEMARLYANVAGTTYVAMTIDEIDLAERIEPVVTSVLGSTAVGAIPGASGVASFLAAAVTEGAANAFLTLRVGIIARAYCGTLSLPDRRALRRSATAQAAGELGALVAQSTKALTAAVVTVAANRAKGAAASLIESARSVFRRKGEPVADGS